MAKLTVLVGPPGSGKSTLASSLCDNIKTYYINQDKQGKQHLTLFQTAVVLGKDIVVDRMGFSKSQRDRYLQVGKTAGYDTEIIVLHESRETCLKRCIARFGHHETVHTVEDANNALDTFFTKYERPTPDEADKVTFVYPKHNLQLNTIIVDIDNTLSDSNHRQHYLDGDRKNWKGFFDAMGDDPVNDWCKKICNTFRQSQSSIIVTICSGRPDSYKKTTKDWLEKHKVQHDELFMRHRSDSRKDSIIKEIILDFEIKTRFSNVLFAVDDRKQVIEMWRSRGIIVLDCAGEKGNF